MDIADPVEDGAGCCDFLRVLSKVFHGGPGTDMKFDEIVGEIRALTEPRSVEGNPLRLACSVASPATKQEIAKAWQGQDLPPDLIEMWLHFREAQLFEDVDYGQWGMRVLSPTESFRRTAEERAARPSDFSTDDIVVAEFLGDQDLLVRSSGSSNMGGELLVALPLDPRSEWYKVGPGLPSFFSDYLSARGSKCWE